MAGDVAGSVIVDTELNSDGFKAGSAELLAAIKSLSSEVKALGQILKETFSGSGAGINATDGKVQELEATVSSLRAEVQTLKATITELQGKLDELGKKPAAETPVSGISQEAQEANAKIAALQAKIKQLEGEMAGMQSELEAAFAAPANLDFDTDAAEAKIEALENKVRELEATIAQLQTGGATATPTANFGGTAASASGLQRQVDAVNNSVSRLEPTFQKALGGSESALTSFEMKASELESKIAGLRDKMATVANTKTPTSDYKQLSAEVERAGKKLESLLNRQEKMQATGVKENTRAWTALQYELDQTARKYDALDAAKRRMEASGRAFYTGADTAEYQRLVSLLDQASQRLAEMRSGIESSDTGMSRLATGAKSVFGAIRNTAKTIGGKMLAGLKSAASHMGKLLVNGKALRGPFDGLTSSLKRLVPALLMARGIMGILRQAVNAYMQENQELANTLSACWSGIGNLLGPIITRLINLVATAVAYVTQFLSLLGFVGKSTTKAISSAGGSASKESQKLKRQLAAFDELTILRNDEDDSAGGGGGGAAAGELPEVELPDWAKLMAEHLKNGEWSAAAMVLTDQLNSMVAGVDWAGVGDKIAYYLNGALEFLATTILTFDWKGLGTGLATSLNRIMYGVDWANLGVVLGGHIIALLRTASGFVTTFDWDSFGRIFADAFMGLWNAIDWAEAARTISTGLIGLVDSITSFIRNIDWQQVGNDVATFIGNIDWGGVLTAICEGIGTAAGGILSFIVGIFEGIFEDIGSYFDVYIEEAKEMGGDWLDGIFLGILDAICNVGTWIYENVFQPFIDGFKSAFGIHSPSTVMQEQGGFIVEGLLLGITNAWTSITTFFSEALSSLGQTLSEAWANIKSGATTAWSQVSTTIGSKWSEIKSTASKYCSDLVSNISSDWASIKSNISSRLGEIKSTASSAWSSIKSNTTSALSSIASNVSSKFSSIQSTISTKVESVKTNIRTGFENAKSNIINSMATAMSTIQNQDWYSVGSNICTGIGNGITAGWNWLKEKVGSLAQSLLSTAKSALGIHSPSRLFRDEVGYMLGLGVAEGMEGSQPKILSTVSGIADQIAAEMTNGGATIPLAAEGVDFVGGLDGVLTTFADRVSDSFAALLARLDAIVGSGSYTVPAVAAGTVVPYSATGASNGAAGMQGGGIDAVQELVATMMADMLPAMVAGFESVVGEQRELKEAVRNIEIGDTTIGRAAARYNRRQNLIRGGSVE